MAQSAPFQKEKTFTSYSSEQGKHYADHRPDYHADLYNTLLDHHASTGGQRDTILDIGCGPGLAARTLAPHFAHSIGLDPSEGMIVTARSLGGVTATSEPIRFDVSSAEELGSGLSPPIADGSVDLITAANAAHWFDMNGFWPSAARVLKPGGSVALWTSGELKVHPNVPNAAAVQAAIDRIEEEQLRPYFTPGNLLTRDKYHSLTLPWTMAQPVADFDKSTFLHKDFTAGENFHVGEPEMDLDTYEKFLATSSPVTRWRQAHPDDAGTERDVVKLLRKEIQRLLNEAGVEEGKEILKGVVYGALLIVKRKE